MRAQALNDVKIKTTGKVSVFKSGSTYPYKQRGEKIALIDENRSAVLCAQDFFLENFKAV